MKKTAIGLICKKTICTCSTRFFCIFFAVVLHDYNVKLPETSWLPVKWRKCCTCTCSIFFCFSRRSCLLWWKQAFLIFSPLQQNFMLFLEQKMFPLLFSLSLVLSLVELCWPVALLSVFSIFLYIPDCGHDN